MITYGFEENTDYILVSQKRLRTYEQSNHILTIENTLNIVKSMYVVPLGIFRKRSTEILLQSDLS